MTLTKSNIVDQVQNRLKYDGHSRQESVKNVDTLIEIIKRTLEGGDDVLVSGFGKFEVKEKAERKGRNPATGTVMMLEPRRVVVFKCSGTLRRKVNPLPSKSVPKPVSKSRKKK